MQIWSLPINKISPEYVNLEADWNTCDVFIHAPVISLSVLR